MGGRTTIIIAHRLSTIALADEIVVLDRRPHRRARHARRAARDEPGLPRDLRARAARARSSRTRSRRAAERVAGGRADAEGLAARRPPDRASAAPRSSDWSWRADARGGSRRSPGSTRPYRPRTALALVSLLAATRPRSRRRSSPSSRSTTDPASDDLRRSDLDRRRASSSPALANWGMSVRADVPHRLDRRADPRRPAQQALPPPAAALARLLRAQPRRRDHQPADERRRGARPARHRRRHEPRPEHADARRHRGHPLLPRLAARARDADRDPARWRRDRALPDALDARLPRACASGSASSRRRSPRTSPACASSRRSRASRPNSAHFREVNDALPRGEPADGRPERPLLPVRRLPLDGRDGDRPRLRRLPRLRAATSRSGRCSPSSLYLHELLRPGPAALAALQHVPLRDGRARQDHGRARRGAGGRRPRRRAEPCRAIDGRRPLRGRPLRLRHAAPRCCTGSTSTSRPGTTVALVGHTGAGKSTIAKLLARFYDPREGRITIDGHDLRDVTQESLRRQLGIVPQEGFLFAGTVAREHRLRPPGRDARGDRRAPRRRSAPTTSSCGSRTATRRSSASAAAASRSASASSSRSRARCSPTRASSSSTRRPRRSTSAPSGGSSGRCARCSPAGRRSSSRTASRRSATPT